MWQAVHQKKKKNTRVTKEMVLIAQMHPVLWNNTASQDLTVFSYNSGISAGIPAHSSNLTLQEKQLMMITGYSDPKCCDANNVQLFER